MKKLTIEMRREKRPGRWIAEVTELPTAMAYGRTEADASRKAKKLARRFLAERGRVGKISLDALTFEHRSMNEASARAVARELRDLREREVCGMFDNHIVLSVVGSHIDVSRHFRWLRRLPKGSLAIFIVEMKEAFEAGMRTGDFDGFGVVLGKYARLYGDRRSKGNP